MGNCLKGGSSTDDLSLITDSHNVQQGDQRDNGGPPYYQVSVMFNIQ